MLVNFKSDNFTGVSAITPSTLRPEQKPGTVLNYILEDIRSCEELPMEKRPDSLFTTVNNEFVLKISASRLVESKFGDILDHILGSSRSLSMFIVIDIVWDESPSCEKVLGILKNIAGWRNYELSGLISGYGYINTLFVKNLDQWRGFVDGKISSWSNLIWSLLTSGNYPVLFMLSSASHKSSPSFLSKIDLESMTKFSRIQDQRIKIIYKENIKDEYRQEYKSPREDLRKDYKIYNSDEKKYPRDDASKKDLNTFKEDPRYYKDFKENFDRKELDDKRFGKTDPRYIPEKKTTEDLYKDKQRHYKDDMLYSDRIYSDKNNQEEEVLDYRKSFQDFKSKESDQKAYREASRPYNEYLANSRTRNFSTDPETFSKSSKLTTISSTRPYKEDSIYLNRNSSLVPKEASPKPGILKHTPPDYSRGTRDSFANNSVSSMLSPKESPVHLSRTLRDTSFPDKYDEEVTEKPSSILKNSWVSDKDYNLRQSKFDSIEKKVNFSDSVYHIEDSNKDQMPEIKIVNMKIPDKKKVADINPNHQSYNTEKRGKYGTSDWPDYKIADLKTTQFENLDHRHQAVKSDSEIVSNANTWACPKCSAAISNTLYECNSCRHINWDRFYALKSKSPKLRSESIPAKTSNREDQFKNYKPKVDSRYLETNYDYRNIINTNTWGTRDYNKEIKVQENYNSEEFSRKNGREFGFNR